MYIAKAILAIEENSDSPDMLRRKYFGIFGWLCSLTWTLVELRDV